MKNPLWSQKTPADQLTVLRWSLQGHLENWQAGIIDKEKFNKCAVEHLEQIEQLEPFLKGEEW
jgi:hypothetical protein